jgi:CPA2 family monovalent cation:H+ antiporter-2
MDAHRFLGSLALVLCVAALTTVVFQRLRQPVVLGYVIAGLIIGPHVPVPLVGDPIVVQTLSELGVILLMFSLGLEFSLRKLFTAGAAGLTAVVQSSIMVWLGFLVGRAFGWTVLESVFTGAVVAISSTTIIAKVFDEERIRGKLRDLVVGVLIVEDLIAVLFMTALTAVATGDETSPATLWRSTGRLAAFLAALLIVGMLVVPRAFRAIARLGRAETTVVASTGLCFGTALLAQEFGYSIAFGAFLAGALVAESGVERDIEHLIRPIRDMFAAIFFVSVGMLLDPSLVAKHGIAVLVLTAVVILGKTAGVTIGAFLSGQGVRTSVEAGMSLAQIGEFSFIIASLGVALGVTGDFLYPVAVAVSAITTLSTPWLIRGSGGVASLVDRKMPRRLQTFAALYGSWVERLNTAPSAPSTARTVRRLLGWLLLDAALLAAVVIGASSGADDVVAWARRVLDVGDPLARALVVVAAAAVAAPLAIGIVRTARGLGVVLAGVALPETEENRVDLADAPRRAFIVTLQFAVILPIALALLALTQPFLWGPEGIVVVTALVGALAVLFWRSATNLQGHVRAGARMIVEALAKQARPDATSEAVTLETVRAFLPGLGEPLALRLPPTSPAIGKTLAQLDVRGRTGATVLAIVRGEEAVIVPAAGEVLRGGDCLALTGTHEAVEAARRLLVSPER